MLQHLIICASVSSCTSTKISGTDHQTISPTKRACVFQNKTNLHGSGANNTEAAKEHRFHIDTCIMLKSCRRIKHNVFKPQTDPPPLAGDNRRATLREELRSHNDPPTNLACHRTHKGCPQLLLKDKIRANIMSQSCRNVANIMSKSSRTKTCLGHTRSDRRPTVERRVRLHKGLQSHSDA